jgi:ubiquinone/menaquinone biosynthesis C-methylase UbiE
MVGIDLSLRMLEFARKSNPFQDVTFVHVDATDLNTFGDHSFDYATILFLLHELPIQQQVRVLKEALRVANRGIIIDSVAPLPRNASGIGIRIVEATFGYEHNPDFKAFLASGGIRGILRESGLPIKLEYSSVFWRNCREVAVVSTQQ